MTQRESGNWLQVFCLEPFKKLASWGTEEQTNLGRLRRCTLNVCGGMFICSNTSLMLLRLAQGRYLHALLDLVATLGVVFALWLAKVGRFNSATWMLGIFPLLLAFSLIQLGFFEGVHMVPQMAMCMLTCMLIFEKPLQRIAFIATCLILMTLASANAEATALHVAVFLVQSLAFAFIFLAYVYFFERQDEVLQEGVAKLELSNQEKNAANLMLNERVSELLLFSQIMSHDLKNPLMSVISYSELIKLDIDDGKVGQETTESVDAVLSVATRMNALVDGLLAYSRLTLTDCEIETVDLNQAIENSLGLLDLQIREKSVSIEHASLPPVHGNAELFGTLFYNILSNAIKYQPDDSAHHPRIKIWNETNGELLCIFIQDNGVGIEPHYLPDLFTPLKRDRSQTYEGNGLGMPICQSIVRKFNGDIEVANSSSTGTTIKLTFPSTTSIFTQPRECTTPVDYAAEVGT